MRPHLRWLSRLEPWLLLGVALWALVFHLRLPGRLPTEADWKALAEVLSAEQRAGDVVMLHPWWTEEARRFLPESLEVLGDPRAVDRDLLAAPRIWLISQPSLPRAGTSRFLEAFTPRRTASTAPRSFGPLQLTRYRNERALPLRFDATQALAHARVWLEDTASGRRVACRRGGAAIHCPGRPAITVREGWYELDFAPMRCVWMPPPGGPRRLVIELDGLPTEGTLHLQGGLVGEEAVQKGQGLTPLHFGVTTPGGEELFAHTLAPGVEGQVHLIHTLRPGAQTVRLWSQSDRADRRALCLRLRAFAPDAPSEHAP